MWELSAQLKDCTLQLYKVFPIFLLLVISNISFRPVSLAGIQ